MLTSGGEPRRYRLHVPPGAAAGAPLPLVVNLHGYSSDAAQQEALSRMSAQADTAGFVAVYPEGRGEPARWAFGSGAEAADDVQFIRDLVRRIEAQLPIDPRRVSDIMRRRAVSTWPNAIGRGANLAPAAPPWPS